MYDTFDFKDQARMPGFQWWVEFVNNYSPASDVITKWKLIACSIWMEDGLIDCIF